MERPNTMDYDTENEVDAMLTSDPEANESPEVETNDLVALKIKRAD